MDEMWRRVKIIPFNPVWNEPAPASPEYHAQITTVKIIIKKIKQLFQPNLKKNNICYQ